MILASKIDKIRELSECFVKVLLEWGEAVMFFEKLNRERLNLRVIYNKFLRVLQNG